MPKLSITVPVFNTEKYLNRCIDSILSQTFNDFELILVDDGSNDNSGRICDNYAETDKRIIVIHCVNGGVCKARNIGIEAAEGEWIGFVDADDWQEEGMYDTMMQITKRHETELVYCDFFAVNKNATVPVSQPGHNGDNLSLVKSFIMDGWTVVWNLIMKRKLIVDNKLYFDEEIKFGEDFVFLLKAFMLAKRIDKVAEPLYYYNRINDGSALNTVSFDYYRSVLKAIISVRDFSKGIIEDPVLDKMFAWKILRAKQDLVLYPDKHSEFLTISPESHKYILSCPWLNNKIKWMMWLLDHRMGLIVRIANRLRFMVYGSSQKY